MFSFLVFFFRFCRRDDTEQMSLHERALIHALIENEQDDRPWTYAGRTKFDGHTSLSCGRSAHCGRARCIVCMSFEFHSGGEACYD